MSIYLDNGATSYPKPESVYQTVDHYMRKIGVSAGRGNYRRAMEASRLLYESRKSIAKVLGAKNPGKIIFTANVTESLNLVLKGFLDNGDSVLTTNFEHNAMWRPLMRLSEEKNVQVEQLPFHSNGEIDLAIVEKALSKKPKLFCFAHGSNVLGNILPLENLTAMAHQYDIPVLVDTAQTAGAVPLKATEWGVDFLAFTGHKSLLGPMGSGGLYINGDTQLKPLKEGGTGSASSSPFQPENAPDRYESGTMNIPAIAGLKSAADYLMEIGVENVFHHEQALVSKFLHGLQSLSGVQVYGSQEMDHRLGVVSFNIGTHDPYDVASWLDEHFEIMVRAGLHCSPQAHRLIGTEKRGAVRVSFGWFNTENDVEVCLNAIRSFIQEGGGC